MGFGLGFHRNLHRIGCPFRNLSLPGHSPFTVRLRDGRRTCHTHSHYNETIIVTGRVAQVSVRSTVAFLNLDKLSPDSSFAAVIFESNLAEFGDLQRFKGQDVEITGTVAEYRNKPEIVLETPDQIKAVQTK